MNKIELVNDALKSTEAVKKAIDKIPDVRTTSKDGVVVAFIALRTKIAQLLLDEQDMAGE